MFLGEELTLLAQFPADPQVLIEGQAGESIFLSNPWIRKLSVGNTIRSQVVGRGLPFKRTVSPNSNAQFGSPKTVDQQRSLYLHHCCVRRSSRKIGFVNGYRRLVRHLRHFKDLRTVRQAWLRMPSSRIRPVPRTTPLHRRAKKTRLTQNLQRGISRQSAFSLLLTIGCFSPGALIRSLFRDEGR